MPAPDRGHQGGSLLALPSNPLLALALASWMADGQSGSATSSGTARSALTDLALGGDLVDASVLQSLSHAGVAGASGSGGASSDGATVSLLGNAVNLDLLHTGTAGSFLASLNGTEVGALSNSSAVPVSIPGVLDLALLQAQSAGGDGGTGNAAIGTVSNLLGGSGTTAGLLGSSSSSSSHPAATGGHTASAPASPAPAVDLLTAPRTVPDTGSVFGLAGLGLLAAGGAVAIASGPRRRRGPALA